MLSIPERVGVGLLDLLSFSLFPFYFDFHLLSLSFFFLLIQFFLLVPLSLSLSLFCSGLLACFFEFVLFFWGGPVFFLYFWLSLCSCLGLLARSRLERYGIPWTEKSPKTAHALRTTPPLTAVSWTLWV